MPAKVCRYIWRYVFYAVGSFSSYFYFCFILNFYSLQITQNYIYSFNGKTGKLTYRVWLQYRRGTQNIRDHATNILPQPVYKISYRHSLNLLKQNAHRRSQFRQHIYCIHTFHHFSKYTHTLTRTCVKLVMLDLIRKSQDLFCNREIIQ